MKRIDLSDSKEWYRTKEQADAYLALFNGSYARGIIASEDRLLNNNAKAIVASFNLSVHYVDLGPGNGEKTLFLCRKFAEDLKLGGYSAVDIQPKFLEVAMRVNDEFNVPTQTYNESFEHFLTRNIKEPNPKFIYLGSTFGNFLNGSIEERLYRFMGKKDMVYLSAGMRPDNIENLIKIYLPALPMFEQVAKRNGLKDGILKVIWNEENSSIEQVYQTNDTNYVLGISKKYSRSSFSEHVSKYFEGDYLVEGEHIGFIGRKK